MFSEILKIIPKIDAKDLETMQKSLQSRFTKLTKSFGKGLLDVIKGGGIAGIAIGLIDKVLNPLKEVQEAIDKTLAGSKDLSVYANQFNTSSGKLFKLVQLAKANGMDTDNLYMLITKFQTAVATAQANPNDQNVNSVRNFIGKPHEVTDSNGNKTMKFDPQDIAEQFFGFVSSLQKMSKEQQILVQQQVFGERQVLHMSGFMGADFTKTAKGVGIDNVSSDRLSGSIDKLSKLQELTGVLAARRDTQDIQDKAGVINETMVRNRDKSEKLALERENARIQSYNDLAALSQTADKIFGLVDEGVRLLGSLISKLLPFVDKMTSAVETMMKSPMIRGVKSWFGGGKDE